MSANQILTTINELNRLISEVKGDYPTILEALKADPLIGRERVERIDELYFQLDSFAGSYSSIGERLSVADAEFDNVKEELADLKDNEIKFLKTEIALAIGSHGSLVEAVKNSKRIEINVDQDTLSLDVNGMSNVKSYDVSIVNNQRTDIITDADPLTSFMDILIKEELTNESKVINVNDSEYFKKYNNTHGTFESGYGTMNGNVQKIPYEFESFSQDSKGYQLVKTKNYDVLFMHSRTNNLNDIRSIFREDGDLSVGYFKSLYRLGSVPTVVKMKRAVHLSYIRLYPFTPEIDNTDFKVMVYDVNHNLLLEESAFKTKYLSHESGSYYDLPVNGTVSFVVLELITSRTTNVTLGFNKIEFFEMKASTDTNEFILNEVDITPLDALSGLTLNTSLNAFNRTHGHVKFGIVIDGIYHVFLDSTNKIEANDFYDVAGYPSKRASLINFQMTNQFSRTYASYYYPSLSSFPLLTSLIYTLQDPSTLLHPVASGYGANISMRQLNPTIKGAYSGETVAFTFEEGSEYITIDGQSLKITKKKLCSEVLRVFVESNDNNSSINRFKIEFETWAYRFSSSYWNNSYNYGSNSSESVPNVITQDTKKPNEPLKGWELIQYGYSSGRSSYNNYYNSSGPVNSMFFYICPSNIIQAGTSTVRFTALPTNDWTKYRTTTYEMDLPFTAYFGVKQISNNLNANAEYVDSGTKYAASIVNDINASYLISIYDLSLTNEAISFLEQKHDVFYKNINTTLFKDGFWFAGIVKTGEPRFAIKMNGVNYVFTPDVGGTVSEWRALYDDVLVKTSGMTAVQLLALTAAQMKQKFSGIIELVVSITDGSSLTSINICKAEGMELIECFESDIDIHGCSSSNLALIPTGPIHSKIKDKAVAKIAITGTIASKTGFSPRLTGANYVMSKVCSVRKPTTDELSKLSIIHYPGRIAVSSLNSGNKNLLIKTIEPQKIKAIERTTAADIIDVSEKAAQLINDIDSISELKRSVTQETKFYVDQVFQSMVNHNSLYLKNLVTIIENMDYNKTIISDTYKRYMGDSIASFIGTGRSAYLKDNKLLLGMVLSTAERSLKTPTMTLSPNTKDFMFSCEMTVIPKEVKLYLNGAYVAEPITPSLLFEFKRNLLELKYKFGFTVTDVALEFIFNVSTDQSGVTCIPVMTSNTAPSGLAYASSIVSATYDAWKSFRRADGQNWTPTATEMPPYIGYSFENLPTGSNKLTKKIFKVDIKSGNVAANHPRYLKVTALLKGVEYILKDWFATNWSLASYSTITQIFTPIECDEIRVYASDPVSSGSSIILNQVSAFEYNMVGFKSMNYLEIQDNSNKEAGAMSSYLIKVDTNGQLELRVAEYKPLSYEILVNGVCQEDAVDYRLEQRSGGCYLIWLSSDFSLETDDEVLLVVS